jgi:hypothetical protein
MDDVLYLLVLAQAVEDVLLLDLGGVLSDNEQEDEELYEEALLFISRYDRIRKRLRKKDAFKRRWLIQIREAKELCLRQSISSGKEMLPSSIGPRLKALRSPLKKCLLQ